MVRVQADSAATRWYRGRGRPTRGHGAAKEEPMLEGILYFVVMAAAMLGLSKYLPGFKVDGWIPALFAAVLFGGVVAWGRQPPRQADPLRAHVTVHSPHAGLFPARAQRHHAVADERDR